MVVILAGLDAAAEPRFLVNRSLRIWLGKSYNEADVAKTGSSFYSCKKE